MECKHCDNIGWDWCEAVIRAAEERARRNHTERKLLKIMALQLDVSISKLTKDANSGKLKALKEHGQWYVTLAEVERYRVEVLGREPIDYTLWR